MNLQELHKEKMAVQINVIFEPTEAVISMQIAKEEQLKEHITKIPALLVCVSGEAIFTDENEKKISLKSGIYVKIEPNIKHKIDAIEKSNFLLIK